MNQQDTEQVLVGVDVGGTKIAVLVTDQQRNELVRVTAPTRLNTPEDTLASIIEAVQGALNLAQAGGRDVAAIGLGIPGRVDPDTGTAHLAVNLKWREIPAGPALSRAFNTPCYLENDVRMAALGLKLHPDFANAQNMAYVSIGTGIAAGLILNGELYRGSHGMAGEIGHIQMVPDGPNCGCGAKGCLEALASGPAIARLMGSSLSPGQVFQLATKGDPVAAPVAQYAARFLAQAMKLLILTYDIETIVFGGGVTQTREIFLNILLEAVEQQRKESELAFEMLRPGMLRLLPFSYDAALWGGIALAERGIKAEAP